ncbi:hypothetical protein Scani_01980 [Streptomyces caniferus]|uniref:Uncharacterized protein n=2 Tax=Streptomyces caniferus TaxID=285557 RepID=A0A640RYI8_9ACTN|nr:hypothetical protein Scani_01980 [Streptomyces caniferus]
MGFRRTRDERLRLLRETVIEARRETAVSITAEIIAHANGASGLPLSMRTGPIHCSAAAGILPTASTLIG